MSRLSKITICFIAALICAGFPSGPCFAFDGGDFQYWSAAGVSFDINKDWKCSFEEEFRFGDDTGVSFKVLENMTDEVFYLWQSSRSAGDWKDANVLGTRLKFRF